MKLTPKTPFDFSPHGGSPALDEGKETIRMSVSGLTFDAGQVQIDVAASFYFPIHVASRYQDVEESMVLVVNDIETSDSGVLLLRNTFMEFPAGEREGPNQRAEPPLPMPGRGPLDPKEGLQGGWLNFKLAFPSTSPIPRYRPSVYLYMILENYVSNVIGLDLVDKKVIEL